METTSATKYAHYLRVSTTQQGIDGLGIDAQRAAVARYVPSKEFVEVESGKKKDRPKLLEAISYCREKGATLVVAKLDRLARNVSFISALMDSKVKFIAADMPEASELTIHIFAAIAQHEASAISARTKAALSEKKKRLASGEEVLPCGATKLGSTMDDSRRATAATKRTVKANSDAAKVAATIQRAKQAGLTLQAIADELNGLRVPTPRGKLWTPTAVRNALARA